VHTLRNWEQGRRTPEGPALARLRIAAKHPPITARRVVQATSPAVLGGRVKQLYQSTGVCMRAVNEYGAPSYTAPKLDSVGPNVPKASSCTSAGATCPVGFRCDYGSGRCIR
jgi:hypothetical protein